MLKIISAAFLVALMAAFNTSAFAADENPLADAKVGEWALYGMQHNMEQKHTVIAVTAEEVTIKTETIMNGNALNSVETKVPLKAKAAEGDAPAGPEPKMSKGTVKVGDKEIACTITEVDAGGKPAKTWTSNDVPVYGMVKSEYDGAVTMELKEWGAGK